MRARIFWKKINGKKGINPFGEKQNIKKSITVNLCNVQVKQNTENQIQYGVDESYSIEMGAIPSISANTVWGALRGLQTFTQIVKKKKIYKKNLLQKNKKGEI